MIKKLILIKLLLTFAFFSLTSSAALQWDVAAYLATGTAIVVTGLTLAAAAPIVISGALAVGLHATVIGLYWDGDTAPSSASGGAASRGVSIILDPNTPLVIPDGWFPPDTGEVEPYPPDNTDLKEEYTATISYSYNDSRQVTVKADSVEAMIIALEEQTLWRYQYTENSTIPPKPVGTYTDQPTGNTGLKTVVSYLHTQTCPSGYSSAGDGTCELINEELVKKPADDVCEMFAKNGSFTPARNDPDCTNTAFTGAGSSQLNFVTPAKSVYVVTSASGEVTVYEKLYDTTTNKTVTNIGNFAFGGDVNYLQTVNQIGNTVGVNPIGSGNGGGGSTEGAALDSSLNVKDGGDEDVADDNAVAGGTSEIYTGVDGLFGTLKQWTMPTTTSNCPTTTITLLEQDYSFDAMCTILESKAGAIQSAMTVFFSLAALLIVLGA